MFWHSCYFMLKIVKIGMLKKVEIHLQEKTGCVGYPSVSFKNRLECIRQKTKQLYERWLFCRLTFPLSTIDDTKTSYTSKKACAEFLCIFKKVFWILMTFFNYAGRSLARTLLIAIGHWMKLFFSTKGFKTVTLVLAWQQRIPSNLLKC